MTEYPNSTVHPRDVDLPAELLAHEAFDALGWKRLSDVHSPEVLVLRNSGGIVGFAVLSSRPHTLSTTVSNVWAAENSIAEIIDAVEKIARDRGQVSVKWQELERKYETEAARAGFVPMRAPVLSGPGTRTGSGWVKYLESWPHPEAPYFRQTTDFTCGPSSVLIAEGLLDESRQVTRSEEMRLWRGATNLRGCDPISLAAVLDLELASAQVYLSTEEPVLLEGVTDSHERELRIFLQSDALSEVRERGVPVERRVFGIDEIVHAVAGGNLVILLIDTTLLHGHTAPHWIVVHAVRDGVVLVDDPWVDPDEGESWLDGHDIPIAIGSLDALAWWGDPAYRGVIVLDPSRRGEPVPAS